LCSRLNTAETYTANFERPLRRRPAMIDRPALVRILNLNPCVLARRRLFG
jgi:hypothetical protein